MRGSRINKRRDKKAFSLRILLIFVFIIPVLAAISSQAIIDLYKARSTVTSSDGLKNTYEDQAAFKYETHLTLQEYYTITLVNADTNKLVGVFTAQEDLGRAEKRLTDRKADYRKSTVVLPAKTLRYCEEDRVYIELVDEADRLFKVVLRAESYLSAELMANPKKDRRELVEEIKLLGERLERFAKYSESLSTSSGLVQFKEQYTGFLRILDESIKSIELDFTYEQYQESLLKQLEAYEALLEHLSV